MKYKTSSGAYKYETIITVRVRFDIDSESIYDARVAARNISNVIHNHITENPDINVENVGGTYNENVGVLPTDVTFCYANVEAVDDASTSVHSPSVWFEGSYISAGHLTTLWNSNLRMLNNKDNEWSHVKMLDTGESGDSRTIVLPTIPQNIFRKHLSADTGEIEMKVRKLREDYVRASAVKLLEGLYEDGLDLPSQDDDNGKPYTFVEPF